jgi:hypothetical protein
MSAEARPTRGPQHMQALQQANAVRLARADLKRRVADGDLSAADVVLESPWEARSMTIADLLTSQCRWGSTRCRRFLQTVPMNEQKTIGSMTERQREALAGQLRSQTGARTPGRRETERSARALAMA